ncbi:carboxypeptidase regulatory-like domain-containing protein [Patescibacteria group bacterium]|nr:carboxypeptidase regulatory-like domain-containing protein [Patescibacteria group bacterium]
MIVSTGSLSRKFRMVVAACIAASFVSLVSGALPSIAARATPGTYAVTRHQISVPVDHEMRFKTPTGVDASSDTIVLTYYTNFDLTGIGIGDIDLFHGPSTGLEVSETLAASPSAGVWGVTTSTASITFTAPTDSAAGEIAVNDFVVIRIGTNASGGIGRIANPSTIQNAQILLAGTFGDTIVVSVPIISNDSVTVTATVEATSTEPPPGGGGGPGDVIAPTISNIQVINITTSTATVTWDTNELASSEVAYGLTMAYGSGTAIVPGLVAGHSVTLTGLTPGTQYHFQILSRDGSGNLATSADATFTTLGVVVLPVISNVQVVNITDTTALVTWSTNVLTNSKVNYGKTILYGSSVTDPGFVTSHSLPLSGLSPSTTYNFSVTSVDQLSNSVSSLNATFKTLKDQTPPANVMSFTAVGGVMIVTLTWTLPSDPDLAGVRIMRKQGTYPTGPMDGNLIFSGMATSTVDIAVVAGTTYYYAAFAYDTAENYASGALAQATPTAPPPTPENTAAACSNGVDDDKDGLIDCLDLDCKTLPICAPPPVITPENTAAACSNGVDDDKDGLIDCLDLDCKSLPVCAPAPPPPVEPPPVEPGTSPEVPIVPPEPEPTPSGEVITISPVFYGANGSVQLVPNPSGVFGAIGGSTVLVVVPLSGLGVSPDRAYFSVGTQGYNLVLNADGTAYTGSFTAPGSGSQPIVVAMDFQGGGSAVSLYTVVAQGGGQVVEEGLLGATVQGIEGATVTLFVQEGGVWVPWNGAPYGQANPKATGVNGWFAFQVPNGRYYAEVEKIGFTKAVSAPIMVTLNVYGDRIGLIKLPVTPFAGVSDTQPLIENVTQVAENIVEQSIYAVTVARMFIQQPEIQEVVKNTVSPALIGVSLINVASALPLFNAVAYAQYLFTQPILLLARRKKKKWGIVYNSLTKQPVELAIVRLRDAKTQLIIQTKVTDKFGRYSFIVKLGVYVIEVVKPGYVFPSQHMKDKTEDVDYIDLYHGTKLLVDVKNTVIAQNIPVDPVVATETPKRILWKKLLRSIQHNLSLVTIIVAMVALVIKPGLQIAIILLFQVVFYLLFRRLATSIHARDWGRVVDDMKKTPISGVIVRIFDKKFNKLLETQVTDANGKYGFFVRRNIYYVTAEREGYEKYTSPDIDLSQKDDALIDQGIRLKKLKT